MPGPRRLVSAFMAVLLLAGAAAGNADTAAAATQVVFQQEFGQSSLTGTGAVVLPPARAGGPNAACLTAYGKNTGALRSCPRKRVSSGNLRLTDDSRNQFGGVFGADSVPTSAGLHVQFRAHLRGTSADPGDGLAFALAAVDPNAATSPEHLGAPGGGLGYAAGKGARGLPHAYLGVGFDVYGNFSRTGYSGSGCPRSDSVSATTRVPGQMVVRGPGHKMVGYCALNSTARSVPAPPLPLQTNRPSDGFSVNVVLNPFDTSISVAEMSVPARSYAVRYWGFEGDSRVLTGPLPAVPAGLYPADWLDASGYPQRLAFGLLGSTGSAVGFHEVSGLTVTTLEPHPELTVKQFLVSAQPNLDLGDPVSYVVNVEVAGAVDETQPISLTHTMPVGVTPAAGFGDGEDVRCDDPVGQRITCTFLTGYPMLPGFQNGTSFLGTVTQSSVTPATLRSSTVIASSADAISGHSTSAALSVGGGLPLSDLSIFPTSGPAGGGATGWYAAVLFSPDMGSRHFVQVGTPEEFATGRAATLNNRMDAAGSSGHPGYGIPEMPAHDNGEVLVKVIRGALATTVRYTYTSRPGTPRAWANRVGDELEINWLAPAPGVSAITSYLVTPYRNGVAQDPLTVSADVHKVSPENLTRGASYTFTVAAVSAEGTGVASRHSTALQIR